MIIAFNAGPRPVEEYFEVAKENGFSYLELNSASPYNWPDKFDQKRIDGVRRLRDKHGMDYGLHSASFCNTAEIIPEFRKATVEHLINYVELANSLEADYLVLHFGYWFSLFQEEVMKCLIENFTPVVELAVKYDLPIAIENMNMVHKDSEINYLGINVEELAYVFDALDSKYIGLALDVAHACLYEDGCQPFIDAFKDKLMSVHISDNDRILDRHLAVGEGKIDFREVIIQLNDAGFKGVMNMEIPNVEGRIISRQRLIPIFEDLGIEYR